MKINDKNSAKYKNSVNSVHYILYSNPHSCINGGGKLPVPATVQLNDRWIRQLQGMLIILFT